MELRDKFKEELINHIFSYEYVTGDRDGTITMWNEKPEYSKVSDYWIGEGKSLEINDLFKFSEFDDIEICEDNEFIIEEVFLIINDKYYFRYEGVFIMFEIIDETNIICNAHCKLNEDKLHHSSKQIDFTTLNWFLRQSIHDRYKITEILSESVFNENVN